MAAQVTGRVHSVESFGTVDGPGVRFVVFLQGCPMRCLYCHNPDTWDPGGGVPTTVEELLAQYARNEAFYRKGGITVTGGEPLLQIEFVTALFREAKRRGIHTCLDTSGATFRPEDAAALRTAAGCGVTLLATAHGAGREDLTRRPLYRGLLEEGMFRRLVEITRREGRREYRVEELK